MSSCLVDIMNIGMEPDISSLAALISEPARGRILIALLDGRGLPATELAQRAGITCQTASSHLAKLAEGRLLSHEAVEDLDFALASQSGLGRLDRRCLTRFDFIEFDEGRTPTDFRQWKLPRQG